MNPPTPSRFPSTGFFTPAGLLMRALALGLFFGLCHLAGLREHVTILSGTTASVEINQTWAAAQALAYLLAYFGFILLAPILILGGGLLALWEKRGSNKSNSRGSD